MMRNIFRYVVMLIALCIFGYAAYEITLIKLEDKETTSTNNSISDMFMMDVSDIIQSNEEDDEEFLKGKAEDITIDNSLDSSKFVWDFDKLLEYNSEAKGYIRQDQGPYVVDNPIMQHSDNTYYLKHLPNNMEAQSGSIFIDCNIKEGLEARNCIIYGHLMSHIYPYIMFGSLRFYVSDEDYAKTHPTFDVYIEDEHYKYYVFAAYRVSMTDADTYQYEFKSSKKFQEYIDKCIEKSVFKYPEAGEVGVNDKIITMSTCTPDDTSKRTIVQIVRREQILDTVKDLKEKNDTEIETVEYTTTDTWEDEEEEETTTEEETTKKKKTDKSTEEETTKKKKTDKSTEEETTKKKKTDKSTEEETTKKKKTDKSTEEETTKKKKKESAEEETTKKKKEESTEEITTKKKKEKSTEEETTKKKKNESAEKETTKK